MVIVISFSLNQVDPIKQWVQKDVKYATKHHALENNKELGQVYEKQ